MRRAAPLIVAAFALAGCTVGTSVPMGDFVRDGRAGCSSALGYYSLPKAVVHMRVERSSSDGRYALAVFGERPFEIRHVPDPTLNFCFRYDSTVFSNDKIEITKETAPDGKTKTSYLSSLTINATDQTISVLNRLLRLAFLVASRDVKLDLRGGEAEKELVVDVEFDPLDPDEARQANAALAPYGFCFVADDFVAPAGQGASVCGRRGPRKDGAVPALGLAYADVSRRPVPSGPGVAYRPLQALPFTIYRKSDPTGPDAWQIALRDRMTIENASPVLSLRIDRAVFAGRRTVLVFDAGSLKSACVSQSSGVLNAATVPIEVLRSLVALPASIVSVRYADTVRYKNLADAETNLVYAQLAAMGLENKYTEKSKTGSLVLTPIDYGASGQYLDAEHRLSPVEDAKQFDSEIQKLCQ